MASPEIFEKKLTPNQLAEKIVAVHNIDQDDFKLLAHFKNESTQENDLLVQFVSALSDQCSSTEFKAYIAVILKETL